MLRTSSFVSLGRALAAAEPDNQEQALSKSSLMSLRSTCHALEPEAVKHQSSALV